MPRLTTATVAQAMVVIIMAIPALAIGAGATRGLATTATAPSSAGTSSYQSSSAGNINTQILMNTFNALSKQQSTSDANENSTPAYQPPRTHVEGNFTGFWKKNCSDQFGIQIAPFSGNKYSVSFCGPGGCFEPGEWRPNTTLVGDGSYQVINSNHIRLSAQDGWSEYIKCSSSTDPKESIQVNTAKDSDAKVAGSAEEATDNTSNSQTKASSVKQPSVNQCIRFENGMGMGGSDDMTAFLVNRCPFKVAVNFCYTGPGVTTGTCADGVGLEWVQPNGKSSISGPWAKSGGKWRWHVFACKEPASPHVVGTATGMKGYCSL